MLNVYHQGYVVYNLCFLIFFLFFIVYIISIEKNQNENCLSENADWIIVFNCQINWFNIVLYIYIYIYIYVDIKVELLNNWKVWHKMIQNQLEISSKVIICLNGFMTMVLRTFLWLWYIQLLILLSMHSLRHCGHSIKKGEFLL